MSLTREQFYNEAIRKNLARFSTDVKVREILPHLQCLTITDREEIEAKRDNSGNFNAMQTLLDNLRRRANWPEEFITALRKCEHGELADEMSAIYDNIRGITNVPRPAPTPAPSVTSAGATATVTTATIHNVPSTTPPKLNQPAGDAPVHSTAPSNTESPVPQVPEAQQVPQVPPSVPTPSPKPKITPVVVAPSQAPLPDVVSAPKVSLPVQQEVPTLPKVAENTTPVLDTLDGLVLTDQTTTSSSIGETLPSTASSQESVSNTSQVQITNPCTTTQLSQSLEKMPVAVKDVVHSEKLSVQDTNPPLREERTFQAPVEISGPTATELVQRNNTVGMPVLTGQTNLTAQATSSAPTEVENSPSSISEDFYSKPGILQHPEPQQNRAGTPPNFQEEPCSVVTDDLEISRSTISTEPRQSASPPEQTSSPIASHDLAPRNQPEEDHYESVCESQTLVNVIQFAEEPPAENLNGQPASMLQHSRVNSEEQPTLNHVGKENVVFREPSGHVADVSDHKKSTTINAREQESNAATSAAVQQPEQREEGRPELFRINNLHLIAGAGIALSAVFLAWRLQH